MINEDQTEVTIFFVIDDCGGTGIGWQNSIPALICLNRSCGRAFLPPELRS